MNGPTTIENKNGANADQTTADLDNQAAGGCASAGGTDGRADAAEGATAGQSIGLVLRVSCARALYLPT